MPLRRGFKSWCETIATQQRKTLGLTESDPLDPRKLASHMGISIMKAEDVPGVEKDVLRTLLHDDADSWSAITLGSGNRHLIVINSSIEKLKRLSEFKRQIAEQNKRICSRCSCELERERGALCWACMYEVKSEW